MVEYKLCIPSEKDLPYIIKLMKQLTDKYLIDKNIEGNQFGKLLSPNCQMVVVKPFGSHGYGNPIATGSVWIMKKIHQSRAVGQIEDVVVDEKFRGKGIGKLIIKDLINYAENVEKCYKVILNCSKDNEAFYESCGFYKSESQMRIDL